jgi:exodeoxyribonuclease VII small subunit
MPETPNDRTDPALEPTFEQALDKLEGIVHALEEGEIGLDESLEKYEQGVKLLRRCHALLQQAERRIELLTGIDAEGNPLTQPFDDAATFSAEAPTGKAKSRRRPSTDQC